MASAPDQLLEVEKTADATVARFRQPDHWDDGQISAIGMRLSQLLGDHGCRRLVVNLGHGGEWASSRLLARLVLLSRQAEAAGREIVLCDVDASTRLVLKATGLDGRISIFPDERQALEGHG